LSRALFIARHAVFVERRGWRALSAADGLERDQYDDPDTVYLIGICRGRVIAGLRLSPTVSRHPLRHAFSFLLAPDALPPAAADVWDLSRFFVVKGVVASGQNRDLLLAALFSHCRQSGIRSLLSVVDARLVPHLVRIGLAIRPLGPARPYAEGVAVAVVIDAEPTGPFRAFQWSGCRRERAAGREV
jgi:acyl-homoserine lactone synthase